MKSIFQSSNSNSGISNEQVQILRVWNNAVKHGCTSQETFNKIIANADENTKMYFSGLNKGKGSVEGLKNAINNTSLSAKAGQAALQGVAIAGNMLAMMTIGEAISLTIKGIDYLVHYEEKQAEAFKKASESTKQISEDVHSLKAGMSDTASKAKSLSSEYAKLVQGVNAFTNENKSLSTKNYERFLELNTQLAELFPSLTKKYDDNGNAILGLSGGVDSVTASIERLVEQQNNLAKIEIRKKLDEYIEGTDDSDGIFKSLEGCKKNAEDAERELSDLEDTYNSFINKTGRSTFTATERSEYYKGIENKFGQNAVDALKETEDIFVREKGPATYTIDFSKLELDEATMGRISQSYDAFYRDLKSKADLAISELDTKNQEMSSMMMTWVEDSSPIYKNGNAPMKRMIETMVSNLKWSDFGIQDGDSDTAKQLIQSSILTPLNAACENPDSQSKVMNAFNSLFSAYYSDMPYDKAKEKIKDSLTAIMEALNNEIMDESQKKTLDDMYGLFGFESYNENDASIKPLINNIKEKLHDEFDGKVGMLTLGEIKIAAEQIEVPEDELLSWDELLAKVKQIQESTAGGKPSLTYADRISPIQSLSQGLSQLSKIYADVSNQGDFDWSSILNNKDFEETFGSMTNVTSEYKTAYSSFIQTISNYPDNINACQSAFDKLSFAYISNSDALKNVTAETRSATINMLEQMDIANAQVLVDYQLANKELNLTQAKSTLAEMCKTLSQSVNSAQDAKHLESLQSIDLENATYGEIQSLIEEADMLEISSQSLVDYSLQKMRAGDTAINTADDINNILTLAKASGVASSAISKLQGLKAQYDKFVASGNSNAAVQVMYDMQREAADIQREVLGFQPTDIDLSGKDKTPAASSTKNTPTPETFNWLETLLSRLSSAFDKLKQKGEDTFLKFTTRADSCKSALENVSQQIAAQQQAYDTYMARANSVGLSAEYIDKIQNGSLSIEEISDDSLKEKIKEYQSWYEKALECGTALENLQKTQKELAQEKLETLLTQYDKLLSRLEAKNTRTENYIDLKEVWGGSASKDNYKDMNKNILSQISNLVNQNRWLKNLQSTVENTSEAWYEYGERMEDNNSTIQKLTKSMAENAKAGAALAGQRAQKRNDRKDSEDENTDTKLSTASTSSRKNRLINSKLGNIDGRQGNLKTAYDTSRKARNSYGNKILKANRKDVSKKNKKYFSKAIASVKSGSLIPASTINGITNAMKTAEGKEYQELSTLLSYCIYYNANKQAEDENKLNYEMYALTAQAEKKSLREEQLQNNLDKNQSKADRNTMSMANTASAKNHNLDAQTRLNNQNVTSYKNAATKATSDRKKAASKAKFNTDKTYKNLKNKTLKKRLASVISTIKKGKKVSSDGLKAVKTYCQKYLNGNMTYYYNCEAYNEAVENELSAKDAGTLAQAEAYAANLQARIEKTENNVSGRDSENELYAAAAKNQTTAKAKNSYIDKQSSIIGQNLNDYKETYVTLSGEFSSAKKSINKSSSKDKSKQKIITEIKSKYVSKNELIPSNYIEKAYTVSNSFGLACENYNEALEAKNSAQETYELYQQTAQTEKAALALEKMSNIDKEHSNKQSVNEQKATKINHAIDLAQAKGYQVSTTYYSKLIENEENTNQTLKGKRQELINSLAESMKNGSIVKYSDEWYEACASIDSVTNEIDKSTLSLIEFNNQMRQIEWDNFDYLENRIRNVTSEADFMINELSRKDLTSDDAGGLTDNGKAVAALHAANYETYRKQAEDYKEKISEINKSLANDPYNKALLNRKQELIQSYQDSIKAAQDEKDAVIDLNEQGYDALLNKIKSLISEYEGLLDAQKDAFDYQNTISDKTKEIANLRKQLSAYAGDMSEEARAKIQSLTVSLEEAERDLQETQYNKYISDTKSMLSDLSDNFEDAIQALIDSLSEHFDLLMNDIDSDLSEISKTITGAMTGIGYIPTEEFKTILDSSGISASVTKMTDALDKFIEDMRKNSDKTADEEETGTGEAGTKESGGTGGTTSNATSAGTKTLPLIASGTEPLRGLGEVNLPNAASSGKRLALKDEALNFLNTNLKITTKDPDQMSALNRALYNGFGKVLTTAKIKELAKILGVRYDNNKSTGTVYKKLKELGIRGFKTGSWNIPYDQLAFLGEGSYELQFDKSEGVLRKVGQGDIVLDANASKNLLQLLNTDPEQLIGNINIPVPAPAPNFSNIIENRSTGDVKIDMGGIVMNGVNDPKEFTSNLITAINTNAAVKKVMLNHTVGTLSNDYHSLSGRQFTP